MRITIKKMVEFISKNLYKGEKKEIRIGYGSGSYFLLSEEGLTPIQKPSHETSNLSKIYREFKQREKETKSFSFDREMMKLALSANGWYEIHTDNYWVNDTISNKDWGGVPVEEAFKSLLKEKNLL